MQLKLGRLCGRLRNCGPGGAQEGPFCGPWDQPMCKRRRGPLPVEEDMQGPWRRHRGGGCSRGWFPRPWMIHGGQFPDHQDTQFQEDTESDPEYQSGEDGPCGWRRRKMGLHHRPGRQHHHPWRRHFPWSWMGCPADENEIRKNPVILKKQWIQECRRLWRQEIMAKLPEDQKKNPGQVMSEMTQPTLRNFLEQCWQSGISVLERAEIEVPLDSAPIEDLTGDDESPKELWISQCCETWKKAFADACPQEPNTGTASENVDPCPGFQRRKIFWKFRQYMAAAWQQLLEATNVSMETASSCSQDTTRRRNDVEERMEDLSLAPE